jgi:predicted outer membrane repeat protein
VERRPRRLPLRGWPLADGDDRGHHEIDQHARRSTAGGTPQFRILSVSAGTTASLSGLTISNGSVSGGGGGAIFVDRATLTVTNCVFSQNTADTGGAIHSSAQFGNATLTITNSTFSQNTATSGLGQGGAINSHGENGTATLTVTNSTINGNTALEGGGIFSVALTASGFSNTTVVNSTLSQNIGTQDSGAIINDALSSGTANLKIINSTLFQNSSPVAGGIFNFTNSNGTAILGLGNLGGLPLCL